MQAIQRSNQGLRPQDSDHQRLKPSVRLNWILGKRYERASEQKQNPSIVIDVFNEAAWDDTPNSVNTDWLQSEFGDASRPGSLDFSEQ